MYIAQFKQLYAEKAKREPPGQSAEEIKSGNMLPQALWTSETVQST